jgi:hypothetical protein
MKKALEMGRTSAAGGFQLFLGRVISTVIMAVGTIILGGLILPSDYGLYTVALIPATTLMLFQDWGVSAALTRHCAKCRRNTSFSINFSIVGGNGIHARLYNYACFAAYYIALRFAVFLQIQFKCQKKE